MRWVLLLILSLGTLYGLTLCPTVAGGDSGELTVVASKLGVAHPPGYPIYILFGYIFTYWPWGSVALKINLMSAVFSVFTAVVIFLLLRHWLKNSLVAFVTALGFSVAPLVWRYSVVAEVFTLNNLFTIVLLALFYLFISTREKRYLYALSLIFGLACSHHHTILFVAVPLFLWAVVFYGSILFRPRTLAFCLALFAAGFLPYLYLFVAPAKGAMYSWGNISSFQDLATHFLRREYGTFQLASGDHQSHFLINIWLYSKSLFRQTFGLFLVPLVIGFYPLIKDRDPKYEFFRVLLFCYLFGVLLFNALANIDLSVLLYQDVQSRFWIVPLLLFFLLSGVALHRVTEMKASKWKYVPLVLCCLGVPMQIACSYRQEDQSKNHLFYNLGRAMIGSLPQDAVVLLRGDVYVNSVRYLQDIEGFRRDVQALPLDLLWWPWMKEKIYKSHPKIRVPAQTISVVKTRADEYTFADFLEANQNRFSILSTKLLDLEAKQIESRYHAYSLGFLSLYEKKEIVVPFSLRLPWFASFDQFRPPGLHEFRAASWEAFVFYNYWDREFARIYSLMVEASQQNFSAEHLNYLEKRFAFIFSQDVEPPAHIYKNAGLTYQFLARAGRQDLIPPLQRAWGKYVDIADPGTDPEIPKIRSLLEQLKNQNSGN